MENNKKIIKAITKVVVQTMYQHGTLIGSGKNNDDVTKKVVRKAVKKLIDSDMDYVDIVNSISDSFLEGIK